MEQKSPINCDGLRDLAKYIESSMHNIENGIYPSDVRFTMMARLQELKPSFLESFYDHAQHDCLGRLSLLAFQIETESYNNSNAKLAEVIQLHKVA